jgi:alpha-L-fucosidase
LQTPEQRIPGVASENAWEACITMGTQWQYKPTNDDYKSATRMIEILIETRAKGGSLLLNVGPKPNGSLPDEQEARLQEMAAWHFINQEALHEVRPWIITNEGNIWMVKGKDESTVYAFITKMPDWPRGERREFVLRSLNATDNTEVTILGQSDELVEYNPDIDATTRWEQNDDALHISCVRAQRIYNNHRWHNPLVLKITNVTPALEPPLVITGGSKIVDGHLVLLGKLMDTGDAESVEVGFMYREYLGFAENLGSDEWFYTEMLPREDTGEYEIALANLEPGKRYEYKAVVRHPKIEMSGDNKRVWR